MRHLLSCVCSSLLFISGLYAETFNSPVPASTEPAPPAWAVYIPIETPNSRTGETATAANADDAGYVDANRKCHWYSQENTGNAVADVKGAWFTYIVFFNGVHITNNTDAAIWNTGAGGTGTNGTSGRAVLTLKLIHQDPREYILQVNGVDLKDTDNYSVMRMAYVQANFNNMPSSPYTIGSPTNEEFRQHNESQSDFALPAAGYWISADEVSYSFWEEISGDATLDATITKHLQDDLITGFRNNYIGLNQPITYMSYDEVTTFCSGQLSAKIGTAARLPNEAEWEYACRAGKDSTYSNFKGYTLDGISSNPFDAGNNNPVDDNNIKDYYEKVEVYVNGSNTMPCPVPNILTSENQWIGGAWVSKAFSVFYTIESEIKAIKQMVSKSYIDANYNSHYKKWFGRAYAFDANQSVDTSSGYFSVDPNNGNNLLLDTRNDWDKTAPAGMYATSDALLAKIVKGLYVPVGYDPATDPLNPWYYTHDPDEIADYRKVVDDIMPNVDNQTPRLLPPADGLIQYYKLHEYNNNGYFLGGPLIDISNGGGFSNEDVIKADLDWENGYPAWVDIKQRKSIEIDAKERLQENFDDHKANNASYSHIHQWHSVFDYIYTVNSNGMIQYETKFEHRNNWGIGHVHGNVAEWCIPGGRTSNINKRWDGIAPYIYDVASPTTGYSTSLGAGAKKYVAARGGSWKSSMEDCRSAYRMPVKPTAKEPTIGFRFVIP